MEAVVPFLHHSDRYLDRSLFMEHCDDSIRRDVVELPMNDLSQERSALITRLLPKHTVHVPILSWPEAQYRFEHLNSDQWLCSITVPMDDRSCCGWSIEWPSHYNADHDANWERGLFTARCKVRADSEQLARESFAAQVVSFQTNLLRAAAEIERYNAALPYFISHWIDLRLNGCLKG